MSTFVQAAVTGLLLGGVYGLVSMGLSLVFGVMRIVNFAHGELLLIGMYTTFVLYTSFGLNPFVGLIFLIPAALLFGAALYRLLLSRVTGTTELRQLLLTLGLGLVIQSLAQIIFTPNQLSLPGFAWGSELVRLGPIFVRPAHAVGFTIAVAVTVALTLLLTRSDLGRAMRATVDDAAMAESCGVRSRRIYMVAMALGTCIAAIAGAVLITYYPVSPTTGASFLVIAFVSVVLGGLGNVIGAFLGGVVAGLVQQFTATYVAVELQDVGLFALFIAVLIFRPYGLLGRQGAV
ncbi:MAG: branched-chain amino acid ABC transporter permease [Actinomycetota bacterium]|nr:branched-chain amino acid ABC transporter permease [Actinomycetota bacterium]